MRVLLSTIGSRGDVQPMVAVALRLRDEGHQAILCAPPGFDELIEGSGLPYRRMGHDLRAGPRRVPGGAAGTAAAHFTALRAAADGCDVIVGCAAMQIAGRSIAEAMGIPYHYAAYAPVALPSVHHAPPPVIGPPRPADTDNRRMWDLDARWWNQTWRAPLNAQRAAMGLRPVSDVRRHVLTDRPLLAADPTLAPWPSPDELAVAQTGAWLTPDSRPLAAELRAFLDAGDPPILFTFGSMLVARASGATVVAAARAVGRRAIVLPGWAGLTSPDASPDRLFIGETNLPALLRRVAAIVHHGGSGTTTQAMLAGVPQVIVAHSFDQPYFAERVAALGIGVAHPPSDPTPESLAQRVEHVLAQDLRERARALGSAVRMNGTELAARFIVGD